MCKIVVRSRTFRYFRRNSEPCLLSQVKKIVCFLFCWRQFTAATGCSLQLDSTAHPAPDTTLRRSACSRVKTCGSSETVYLLALPSSVALPKLCTCLHCHPLWLFRNCVLACTAILCGSSETVYLLALPSAILCAKICVTKTNGIRSVLKIFTDFQNSSY